jgi:peptide/nickel transport system permease protein
MAAVVALPARRSRTVTVRKVIGWWPWILMAFWALLLAFPQILTSHDPLALDQGNALAHPSAEHWFGTDDAGRDVFTRCVYGLRYSLGAGIIISLLTALLGTIIGGIAGLGNRWVDAILMRTTDIFLAFPYLIMAIAIAAALGPSLSTVIITLLVLWWPSYARMVRGQVLSLRESAFVIGAEAAMTPRWKILTRHLVPHMLPALSARISLEVGHVVLALTGLGFLGLGVRPPTPELGSVIAGGREFINDAWWISTLPGIFVVAVVLSSMVLSDWIERRIE